MHRQSRGYDFSPEIECSLPIRRIECDPKIFYCHIHKSKVIILHVIMTVLARFRSPSKFVHSKTHFLLVLLLLFAEIVANVLHISVRQLFFACAAPNQSYCQRRCSKTYANK